MTAPAVVSVADLQLLQRVYTFYKRGDGAHLPAGCTQIELVDEDDLTNWFVQLRYVDENNDDFFVALRLCFLSSGASSLTSSAPTASTSSHASVAAAAAPVVLTTRMPLVFVISPRLVASFIHHGAICSLELMSTAWELNTTNMTLLLLALSETLNPFSPGSRVTVDDAERGRARRAAAAAAAAVAAPADGVDPELSDVSAGNQAGTNSYSQEEHTYGIAYIRTAHPHLFRNVTSTHKNNNNNSKSSTSHASDVQSSPVEAETTEASAMKADVQTSNMHGRIETPPPLPTASAAAPVATPLSSTLSSSSSDLPDARPLRTFADIRDAVLTSLTDADQQHTNASYHLSLNAQAVLAPDESLSSTVAVDVAAVDHNAFAEGTAPLDIYMSTAWRAVLPDDDKKSPHGVPRSLADIPLARRRSLNKAPQRLCPLWIPSDLRQPRQTGAVTVGRLDGGLVHASHDDPSGPAVLPVHIRISGASDEDETHARLALCLWGVESPSGPVRAWVPLPAVSTSTSADDAKITTSSPNTTTATTAQSLVSPSSLPHKPKRPQRVGVPACTIPHGLTVVLTDTCVYGHVRVLGALEFVRCTFIGSIVAEATGRVAMRDTRFAVCTEDQLFWSRSPFLRSPREVRSACDATTVMVPSLTGEWRRARVVFGPWTDVYASDEDSANPVAAAAVGGAPGEAGAGHLNRPMDAVAPPPPPAAALGPLSTLNRREGVLVLDSASVELDMGTRASRLPSLPSPVCVLEESEVAANLACASAGAASAGAPPTAITAAAEDAASGVGGDWLGVVCRESGASCAVPLSVPRVFVLRAFILVSNQGQLRLLGVHLNPGAGAERAIFAEQDANVDILQSTVFTGIHSGISIQGCRGHMDGVLIIGTAMRTPAWPGADAAARVGEARCAGLNVELGGILTARFCVTRHVFFGFSVIAHSVAHLDGCHAEDVMNGFTIDASTATMHNCSAETNHVGVFVLHQAKCVLSDDRGGALARRVRHLAETWRRGRAAVEERQDDTQHADQLDTSPTQSQSRSPHAAQRKPWWCTSAEAFTAIYDVLPRDQADEPYMEDMSQLFSAHIYRASMQRRVGRVAAIDVSRFNTSASPPSSPVRDPQEHASRKANADNEEKEEEGEEMDCGAGDELHRDDVKSGPTPSACSSHPVETGVATGAAALSLHAEDGVGTDGLLVSCAFIGGRFGLEVRGAVLEADSLTILDATEAAVYAYEGGTAKIANALMWASPLMSLSTRPRSGILDKLAASSHRANGEDAQSTPSPHSLAALPRPPSQVSSVAAPVAATPARSCGVKLVSAEGILEQCLTVQCAFGFAAVRGARLQADGCMALRGLNGFTIDDSTGHLHLCGADTDQVAVFVLNRSVTKLTGPPHRSGLSSADRPLPRLICGGFPALYAGRLYGIETQSSQLTAIGITVSRGCDSGFNLHSNSHAVLQQCLVSLSPDDVKQFIMKQARRHKGHSSSSSPPPIIAGVAPPASEAGDAEDGDGDGAAATTAAATTSAVSSGDIPYDAIVAQVAILSMPVTPSVSRSTGVKVWASSQCAVDEVEVRCSVFAYAAMGPDSSLDAHHCVARHVVNGFIVESASVVLTKCSASCSHVAVSVFSNGKCVLRRGTYTSKRQGIECRGGVLQVQGHVKIFGFELVGVLLREQAHLSADRASFLEVKAARPATGSGAPQARLTALTTTASGSSVPGQDVQADAALDDARSQFDALAPDDPDPIGEPNVFPVCLSLEQSTAHIHQGDLGGGAACGVRCHAGGQLFLRLTRLAGCTTVGIDVLNGGHVQLRSCAVQCLGRCAVVVRRGGECRASRAREDDSAELAETDAQAQLHPSHRTAHMGASGAVSLLKACWCAWSTWLSRCVPLPFASSPHETHRRAPRTPTHGGGGISGSRDGAGGGVQRLPLVASLRGNDDGVGRSVGRPPLFPRRANGTFDLGSFLKQYAPLERRPAPAWLAWLESAEGDKNTRALWWYEEEGEESAQQDARPPTLRDTCSHHCSYDSTVLVMHNRQRGGAVVDVGHTHPVGSPTSDASPCPAHAWLWPLPMWHWWRRRGEQTNRATTSSTTTTTTKTTPSPARPSESIPSTAPWSHALLRTSLDALPTFSHVCAEDAQAHQHQGGTSTMTTMKKTRSLPTSASVLPGSVWMQREGWRVPAACSPFSTRTGVSVPEEAAACASAARPAGDAAAASSSSPPAPPRWFVGFSGAFHVHGLCVLERVVVQPTLAEQRDATDTTRRLAQRDRQLPTETTARTVSPGEELYPQVRPRTDRLLRRRSGGSSGGHRRRRDGLGTDEQCSSGEPSPQRPTQDAQREEPRHCTQSSSPQTALMRVTGELKMRECVVLCSPAAHAVVVGAAGPGAHVVAESIHVGRQQGALEVVPRTSLFMETDHHQQQQQPLCDDTATAAAVVAPSPHTSEWFMWPSVVLPRSDSRVVNVVPHWCTCTFLSAQGGATGILRDVRPLPSRLVGPTSDAPPGAGIGEDNANDDEASHSDDVVVSPFSGAVKLCVHCDAGGVLDATTAAGAVASGESHASGSVRFFVPQSQSATDSTGHPNEAAAQVLVSSESRPAVSGSHLTFLGVSCCTFAQVTAVGALARLYLCATVVSGGGTVGSRDDGDPAAAPAAAVVSAQDGAKLLDWGCLFASHQ